MRNSFYLALAAVLLLSACDVINYLPSDPQETQVPLDSLLAGDVAVTMNPSGIAPLTALAQFQTKRPARIHLEVLGREPLIHAFPEDARAHVLPILGLYAGRENRVVLRITEEGVGFALDTLRLQPPALPESLPAITIKTANMQSMEDGWTLSELHLGTSGIYKSMPFMFDTHGDIRWYLDLSAFEGSPSYGDVVWMAPRLANGHLGLAYGSSIYEYDMLGREVDRWDFEGYSVHHDLVEMPNGDFLIGANRDDLTTVEDHVLQIDRRTKAVKRVWDLRQILDNDRFDLFDSASDWLHLNSVWYDERSDALVISGRQQGIMKVSMDNELIWILAPHRGWGPAGPDETGLLTSDYLLTAVDAEGVPYPQSVQDGTTNAAGFSWTYGQHAAMYLPSGELLAFDNGARRNFQNIYSAYSRAVAYQIDETRRTVRQVWQFGMERGPEFSSMAISDVDFLPTTGHILVAPGQNNEPDPHAYVTEVTRTGQVVFDARIAFKNALSSGGTGWGKVDIIYRSERMTIYPASEAERAVAIY